MAKTKYAEVVFETGSHSVVSYDDLDELKDGLKNQNDRALRGSPGGPTGHAGERVAKVLLYDTHPGDLYESGLLSADEVKKQIPAIIDGLAIGGQVSIWELVSSIRGLLSPITNREDGGPHDSIFLASETSELPLDFLKEAK